MRSLGMLLLLQLELRSGFVLEGIAPPARVFSLHSGFFFEGNSMGFCLLDLLLFKSGDSFCKFQLLTIFVLVTRGVSDHVLWVQNIMPNAQMKDLSPFF